MSEIRNLLSLTGLAFHCSFVQMLLVAVALIAYDRVVGNEPIEVISDSRSAEVFQSITGSIEENIPSDAPGWIVQRYEELVNSCDPVVAE